MLGFGYFVVALFDFCRRAENISLRNISKVGNVLSVSESCITNEFLLIMEENAHGILTK